MGLDKGQELFELALAMPEKLIALCGNATSHIENSNVQVVISAIALEAAFLATLAAVRDRGDCTNILYDAIRETTFAGTILDGIK